MNHHENNIKAQLTGFLFSTSESLLIEESNHWTMGALPKQNMSQGTWTGIVFTGSFACIWSELGLVVSGNHSQRGKQSTQCITILKLTLGGRHNWKKYRHFWSHVKGLYRAELSNTLSLIFPYFGLNVFVLKGI